MIPELSRALARIKNSPFGRLTDPSGSHIQNWSYIYGQSTKLPETIKENLKIAEISYREPYRFVEIYNRSVFEDAKWWDAADYKILGTLLGGIFLVQAGVDSDGSKLVYTYEPMSWAHITRVTVSSFDAFMAQNQSPITWTKNDAKLAQKPNSRTTKGRRSRPHS